MAEAVAAVANAVMVIVVAVLGFVVYEQQQYLIPPLLSAWVGALMTKVAIPIDPVMALLIGPAITTYVIAVLNPQLHGRDADHTPLQSEQALKLPAQLLGALILGGGGHALTQSNAVAAVGLALGAYLGQKYLWNALCNFSIALGFIKAIPDCDGSGGCVSTCAVQTKKDRQQTISWCMNRYGAGAGSYCQELADWDAVCPTAARGMPPKPPLYGQGTGPSDPRCSQLAPYTVMEHPPTYSDACSGYYLDPTTAPWGAPNMTLISDTVGTPEDPAKLDPADWVGGYSYLPEIGTPCLMWLGGGTDNYYAPGDIVPQYVNPHPPATKGGSQYMHYLPANPAGNVAMQVNWAYDPAPGDKICKPYMIDQKSGKDIYVQNKGAAVWQPAEADMKTWGVAEYKKTNDGWRNSHIVLTGQQSDGTHATYSIKTLPTSQLGPTLSKPTGHQNL